MKKYLILTMTILCAALLTGCGIFNKEYVSVNDYAYPVSNAVKTDSSSYSASNMSELKTALLSLVDSGETEGQISISEFYADNITEDMDNAIWQVKSQDALCAYCVKSITYDIVTIVSYNEINVHISYLDIGIPLDNIHKLQYSTDLGQIIETSINNCEKKLVILVNKSSFSSDDMVNLVGSTYRSNPMICPVKPIPSVTLYSGNSGQRLYEIEFDYGMDDSELALRKESLNNITLFTEDEMKSDDYSKVLMVIERMSSVEDGTGNSIYDALVLNCANSEGKALGFVALCKELGLKAQIVYGQREWEDYCWNIVKVSGNYYHVCLNMDDDEPLKTDEQMWGTFRWNTQAYPACSSEEY